MPRGGKRSGAGRPRRTQAVSLHVLLNAEVRHELEAWSASSGLTVGTLIELSVTLLSAYRVPNGPANLAVDLAADGYTHRLYVDPATLANQRSTTGDPPPGNLSGEATIPAG